MSIKKQRLVALLFLSNLHPGYTFIFYRSLSIKNCFVSGTGDDNIVIDQLYFSNIPNFFYAFFFKESHPIPISI